MTFDAEKIQDFLAQGDKSPPPVFVGRGGVLKDIEEAAATAWKGRSETIAGKQVQHGVAGMTRIVQGAPGAGKTSILATLFGRSSERHGAPGLSRVLAFESSELAEDLPRVLRTVAAAGSLEPVRWREFFRKVVLGISEAGISGSIEIAWPPDVPAPKSLSDLAQQRPRDRWTAPVIVAVDETQALRGKTGTRHALFLQGIHNAVGRLPLSLVLAGLGDTEARAKAMGLTRGLTIHEIGGLDAEKISALIDGFCRHFGIDPSGHEARLADLAAPCEGWPRHLHFAMQALAAEALRCGGDLAGVDWTRCATAAAESRTCYYHGQQSPEMEKADGLTAVVLSKLAEGTKVSGALRLIQENVVTGVAGHELPKGMDADDFFEHLVHQGALQKRADKTLHCPIPSFRSHLIRAGGLNPDAGAAPRRAADKNPDVPGTRKDGDDDTDVGI